MDMHKDEQRKMIYNLVRRLSSYTNK